MVLGLFTAACWPHQCPGGGSPQRTAAYMEKHTKEHSSDASVYSSASGRQPWTEEETEIIKTAFTHFDKVPRNTENRTVFCLDIRLEQILWKNSSGRTRTEGKNLFKNRK